MSSIMRLFSVGASKQHRQKQQNSAPKQALKDVNLHSEIASTPRSEPKFREPPSLHYNRPLQPLSLSTLDRDFHTFDFSADNKVKNSTIHIIPESSTPQPPLQPSPDNTNKPSAQRSLNNRQSQKLDDLLRDDNPGMADGRLKLAAGGRSQPQEVIASENLKLAKLRRRKDKEKREERRRRKHEKEGSIDRPEGVKNGEQKNKEKRKEKRKEKTKEQKTEIIQLSKQSIIPLPLPKSKKPSPPRHKGKSPPRFVDMFDDMETFTDPTLGHIGHEELNVSSTVTKKTDLNTIIGTNGTQNTLSSSFDISKNSLPNYDNFGTMYHTNEDLNKQSETLMWPNNFSLQQTNAQIPAGLSDEFGTNYTNIGTSRGDFGTTDIGTLERTVGTAGDVLGEVNINLGQSDINLGQSDINLGQSDKNLGQSDINLGQSDINLGQSDISLEQSGMYADKYRLNTILQPHTPPRMNSSPHYNSNALTPQQILMHQEVLSSRFDPSNFPQLKSSNPFSQILYPSQKLVSSKNANVAQANQVYHTAAPISRNPFSAANPRYNSSSQNFVLKSPEKGTLYDFCGTSTRAHRNLSGIDTACHRYDTARHRYDTASERHSDISGVKVSPDMYSKFYSAVESSNFSDSDECTGDAMEQKLNAYSEQAQPKMHSNEQSVISQMPMGNLNQISPSHHRRMHVVAPKFSASNPIMDQKLNSELSDNGQRNIKLNSAPPKFNGTTVANGNLLSKMNQPLGQGIVPPNKRHTVGALTNTDQNGNFVDIAHKAKTGKMSSEHSGKLKGMFDGSGIPSVAIKDGAGTFSATHVPIHVPIQSSSRAQFGEERNVEQRQDTIPITAGIAQKMRTDTKSQNYKSKPVNNAIECKQVKNEVILFDEEKEHINFDLKASSTFLSPTTVTDSGTTNWHDATDNVEVSLGDSSRNFLPPQNTSDMFVDISQTADNNEAEGKDFPMGM